MGKSQETFSKKEKEKKKLKKRQEKQEKKEERKANSANGKNIDEMMAYIDENGNISDTPPDPTKKRKEIKLQDIQISIPVNQTSEEDLIRTGVVTFYNESKGYGFIRDKKSNENVFMHQKEIKEAIKIDNVVTFEVEKTVKGLNALNIQKLKKAK
jgi:cold shock CspA family protein/ribosomal protein S18